MPKSAQQPYFSGSFKPRHEHGGAIRQGKRKLARPIDPKRPLHLILRAERARGKLSLLRGENPTQAQKLVQQAARRYQVRVYQYANSGNHLHLLVRGKTRKGLQNFLRFIAGKIAQKITGARKGKVFGKFWSSLTYSRVVEWGKSFIQAQGYVLQNQLEAEGHIPYQPRKRRSFRTPGTPSFRRRRQALRAAHPENPSAWAKTARNGAASP